MELIETLANSFGFKEYYHESVKKYFVQKRILETADGMIFYSVANDRNPYPWEHVFIFKDRGITPRSASIALPFIQRSF